MNPAPEPQNFNLGENRSRIRVIGVGGAGTNAIDRIAMDQSALVESVAVNTDSQSLAASVANEKIQIGGKLTFGLGAGGDPAIGREAAHTDEALILEALDDVDIVFIAAGLGGGTGTGAAPVVAELARKKGVLSVAFVTLPFSFEGSRRQQQARAGLIELQKVADAVICIPNDKLFSMIDENTSVLNAFKRADDLLGQGVQIVWRMLTKTGLINLDFADLRSVVQGKAQQTARETVFGVGAGKGEHKAKEAIANLLESPLLENGAILSKAEGAIVSICGGPDLTLSEVNRIMNQLSRLANSNTHIIMGAAIDEDFKDTLSISIIAAGKSGWTAKSGDEHAPAATAEVFSRNETADIGIPVKSSTKEGTTLGAQTSGRSNSGAKKPVQGTLNLDQASNRGRFEKGEPTIYNGENLDYPTYLRKNVKLGQ